MESKRPRLRVEHLDVKGVLKVVENQGFDEEFLQYVREKELDGLRLLSVTEGILKLWRPKINARKFINFIEDLRNHPHRYLDDQTILTHANIEYIDKEAIKMAHSIECQYQTVSAKRIREEVFTTTPITKVEDIISKIVPMKSFLYPNQSHRKTQDKAISSYVPMDVGKKPRRFFSFSYDHPHFDLRKFKFYKNEKFNDRGYYTIKTTVENDTNKKLYKNIEVENIEDSLVKEPVHSGSVELVIEDHFYEDLCYNDVKDNKVRDRSSSVNDEISRIPRLSKIHEILNTIKFPFLKRGDATLKRKEKENAQGGKNVHECTQKVEVNPATAEVKTGSIYENASECCSNMYDSVHIRPRGKDGVGDVSPASVEDYMEPIQPQKDYCDVALPKVRDDGFLGFIMSIFSSNFGLGRHKHFQRLQPWEIFTNTEDDETL